MCAKGRPNECGRACWAQAWKRQFLRRSLAILRALSRKAVCNATSAVASQSGLASLAQLARKDLAAALTWKPNVNTSTLAFLIAVQRLPARDCDLPFSELR